MRFEEEEGQAEQRDLNKVFEQQAKGEWKKISNLVGIHFHKV